MRIGILTLPLHTNYGGILQAYALQTVLERMGHEVAVLRRRYDRQHALWKRPLVYSKRMVMKYVFGKNVRIFREKEYIRDYPIVGRYTHPFIERYVKIREISSFQELLKTEFDAFVVGSDQVWRPRFFGRIEDAFLSFAKHWDVKRITYAPSFGVDTWEYSHSQTIHCQKLVRKFDLVTVREQSGVALCRKYLQVKASHVLDPTMLLDKNDYEALAANTRQSPGSLLVYILDASSAKTQLVDNIANVLGLDAFQVNSPVENHVMPSEERVQRPVEEWLRGFMDALFVVTDSFHACAFSIIFNKPFVVVGNPKRGLARIHSLLKMFGLESRLVTTDYSKECLQEIDWRAVNEIRQSMKTKCLQLLSDAL